MRVEIWYEERMKVWFYDEMHPNGDTFRETFTMAHELLEVHPDARRHFQSLVPNVAKESASKARASCLEAKYASERCAPITAPKLLPSFKEKSFKKHHRAYKCSYTKRK